MSAEERFDVCTPEGALTGRVVTRRQAHQEGLWHRSAHLWLIDPSATRILLQQRHPSKQTDPGRWDIAVAGHVSAGQTPLEAVVREAHEELGLVLDPTQLAFLTMTKKEYLDPDYLDREWQHVFAGVWRGELAELVLQSEEVVAVRWMDLQEYRQRVEAEDSNYVGRKSDWEPFERWLMNAEG